MGNSAKTWPGRPSLNLCICKLAAARLTKSRDSIAWADWFKRMWHVCDLVFSNEIGRQVRIIPKGTRARGVAIIYKHCQLVGARFSIFYYKSWRSLIFSWKMISYHHHLAGHQVNIFFIRKITDLDIILSINIQQVLALNFFMKILKTIWHII